MTIHFRLLSGPDKKLLYPLVLKITNKGKQKQYIIAKSKIQWYDESAEMVNPKHPDYDILAPKMLGIKLKARKLIYKNIQDVNVFLNQLLEVDHNDKTFHEAANEIIAEMINLSLGYNKSKNLKAENKIKGNIKVYKNVINQFYHFSNDVQLSSMDYNLLNSFKNYQLAVGNSKNTVHNYLRTLRAIYNKLNLKYKINQPNPFVGVFSGLTQKSYNSKKKHIAKKDIELIEQTKFPEVKQKYIDLWLLQFYFGGCDLIDVYYLKKNNIKRDRIYFERNKSSTGIPINLKLHPKAIAILDKYKDVPGEWIFPYAKSKELYESFRSAYGKVLKSMQNELKINVLPNGGFIGSKVARHSFATIGKEFLIHEDILRELMGHERDDVDNYYKDKFPEAVRDEALFRIIG